MEKRLSFTSTSVSAEETGERVLAIILETVPLTNSGLSISMTGFGFGGAGISRLQLETNPTVSKKKRM